MSRLVDPVPDGVGRLSAKGSSAADTVERVAKYIPGEVLAGYLAITALVESGTTPDTDERTTWLVAAGLIGLVFTPLYLNKLARPGWPKRLHIVVGTAAYIVWTYALKGAWAELDMYDALLAGVLLIVFTLITGLLAPQQGDA